MGTKRKLMVSLFSIIFVVFAVVTTFSVVYAMTQQEIETLIDMEYTVEDVDGFVEATYTVGGVTNYLAPVGGNVEGNKLIFKAEDTENAGHFEFPNNNPITLTEENDNLIIKYSYSNTGGKHYIASMDFASQFNKNNMIVEYGIIDSSTGVVNYSTNRYAVVVPANSTNKEYYIKVSIDDKTNYASFTASINWILQGCDPQSAEYLTYESLDIKGSDGVYTASYTGGYLHTGELVYPTEINGSPVTAIASSSTITNQQKSYVKKVVIPDSVTAIENNAFNGFGYLEDVVFGEEDEVAVQSESSNLTTIGEFAFANCSKLNNLDIPSSVSNIGKNAFENCYNLKQMTLPEGVTDLADAMFKNCSSLTSIQMVEDVTNFPAEIFSGCTELVDFKFPKIIETIGKSAFKDCSRLVGELDLYFTTSIGDGAFENCASLTKVTIGENISTLSINTFAGCENVEGFYLLSHEAITTLSDVNVFNNINNSSKIYVIEKLKDEYVADEKWATYSNHFDEIGYTTTGECVDSIEAPILDMRIYGNSIQNGTPTPEAPVEIESVGEKTKNLYTYNKSTVFSTNSNWWNHTYQLKPNTTYTLSIHGIDMSDWTTQQKSFVCRTTGGNVYENNPITLITDDTGIIRIDYSPSLCGKFGNTNKVEQKYKDVMNAHFMIEEGSKVTAYEPYGMYKIPVKVGDEITNIYLDEPLRKVGDVADYIDFKTGKVIRYVEVLDDSGTQTIENSYQGLTTPTEETIDIPEFSTIAGGTTFEVLTSVQPSQIMVKYHK